MGTDRSLNSLFFSLHAYLVCSDRTTEVGRPQVLTIPFYTVVNYEPFNFIDTIEDRVYYHFGFHKIGIVATAVKQMKLQMMQEILGNGHWRDHLLPELRGVDPSAKDQDAICSFFGYMSASNNVSDMPVEIYDLHHPDTHLQSLFTRVQLWSAILHGKPYHLIQPVHCKKVEEAHFELGLTSAAATMEILHHEQWGPELVSIAEQSLCSICLFMRL